MFHIKADQSQMCVGQRETLNIQGNRAFFIYIYPQVKVRKVNHSQQLPLKLKQQLGDVKDQNVSFSKNVTARFFVF